MSKEKKYNILQRYLSNEQTLKEHQQVKQWFRNDRDYPEIEPLLKDNLEERFKQGSAEKESVAHIYDRVAGAIWQKERQSSKIIRLRNIVYRVAAALVIGLFIGIYVSYEKTASEPVYYAAHSPKGSVAEMLLPDGSVIFLNADSRIKYSVDGKDGIREVFLEGEAWFDVAKNPEKPFIVQTPFYNVNVTGTQFNVKAYSQDQFVTATLEEGEIVISSSGNFKMQEEVVLKPGEQISFDKTLKTLTVKNVNTKWFTSWKDNRLILVNMDLGEFVVILERKYGVDIEVKSAEILDLHVDCTIKNESIIEILDILKKTLPISYEIVGQKIEITSN